jgi:2-oxo-3-hexenedioate decarboxylase
MKVVDPTVRTFATEVADAIRNRRQIAPFTARYQNFDVARAYAVAAEVRTLRVAHGEAPLGRKIGFTNRSIWDAYGVSAPIWGDIYDTTTCDVGLKSICNLDGLSEPQIEPEIVFGLSRAPSPDMDQTALLGCVEWVAHGFEIVHSIFPNWKFGLADTIAANGLHGRLMIGPRHRVSGQSIDRWLAELETFELRLFKNDVLVDRGTGVSVLDGPLSALGHLTQLLARDPDNPRLRAGEIVTTGTVTRAFPVSPGETWATQFSGIGLEPLTVTFA